MESLMSEISEMLNRVEKAAVSSKDIPIEELVEILKKDAAPNDKILHNFYKTNPVVSEFVSILEDKQNIPGPEFDKKMEIFFQKHQNYKRAEFQKEILNSL